MTKSNNETVALVVALGVTAAVVGGAAWWLKGSGLLGGGSGGEVTSGAQTTETTQPSSTQGQKEGQQEGTSRNAASGTFASVANVPEGQFTYGGSTTWAPLRGEVDPAIEQALPSFKLVYKNASGSTDGIQKLINGELDFAQSSRPLNADEKRQAQQKGTTLQEIPVMLEGVAIATHPDLPLPGLTLSQLKDIYTSKVTNWNQVGGPNLSITPVSRTNSGTVQYFQETVLEGEPFASNVKDVSTTTEAIRLVSNTPGAIYYASAPEIVGQCTIAPLPVGTSIRQLVAPYQSPYISPDKCPAQRNQLNLSAFQSQTYPLIRPLYVIIRKDGQPAEKAGAAYAQLLQTQAGEELIQKAGFVPLP